MNNNEPGRWALWLSFPLAVILAVASLGGILLGSTYAAETRMQAALSIGNDAGNLVVIVPVLMIAAILALRGSAAARLVWMGTLAYLVYDFLNYALAIHFNSMFLAYCSGYRSHRRADAVDQRAALWSEPGRPGHHRAGHAAAGRRGGSGLVAARAARDAHKSDHGHPRAISAFQATIRRYYCQQIG